LIITKNLVSRLHKHLYCLVHSSIEVKVFLFIYNIDYNSQRRIIEKRFDQRTISFLSTGTPISNFNILFLYFTTKGKYSKPIVSTISSQNSPDVPYMSNMFFLLLNHLLLLSYNYSHTVLSPMIVFQNLYLFHHFSYFHYQHYFALFLYFLILLFDFHYFHYCFYFVPLILYIIILLNYLILKNINLFYIIIKIIILNF